MVDHDQKGIKASRGGEIGDKVTRDLLEGAGCSGVNGGEWGNGRVCISFVLLAGCTTLDVFGDIGGQTGPPEFSCNELTGLQVTWVAS